MKKTEKKLLDSYPFYHFKTAKDFEKFLRTEYKRDDTTDYIDIGGILYTMEEYDLDGQHISYYNKRTGLGFNVETSNRYKNGYEDAVVDEPYEVGCWRNDINYID